MVKTQLGDSLFLEQTSKNLHYQRNQSASHLKINMTTGTRAKIIFTVASAQPEGQHLVHRVREFGRNQEETQETHQILSFPDLGFHRFWVSQIFSLPDLEFIGFPELRVCQTGTDIPGVKPLNSYFKNRGLVMGWNCTYLIIRNFESFKNNLQLRHPFSRSQFGVQHKSHNVSGIQLYAQSCKNGLKLPLFTALQDAQMRKNGKATQNMISITKATKKACLSQQSPASRSLNWTDDHLENTQADPQIIHAK